MKLPRRKFSYLAAGAAALPAVSRIARAQAYRLLLAEQQDNQARQATCISNWWPTTTLAYGQSMPAWT